MRRKCEKTCRQFCIRARKGEIIFPGGDRLEVQSNSYATGSSGYESAADLTQTMTETQVKQTELMDSSMPLKAVPGATAQDSSVLRRKRDKD